MEVFWVPYISSAGSLRLAVVRCLLFAVFPGTDVSQSDPSASGPRPARIYSVVAVASPKTGDRGAPEKLNDRARK